jgi:restriction system protein
VICLEQDGDLGPGGELGDRGRLGQAGRAPGGGDRLLPGDDRPGSDGEGDRARRAERHVPPFDIIPEHKAFKHVKMRKTVEPVAMPPAEAQRLYNAVIAQIAVRTVREVFAIMPPDMVSTVVFNGHVDTVDPATGRKIQPPLISMRATRDRFDELVLTEPRFDPVASIKRHFFAAISQHPEELQPVEPVMPFSRADPRIVEAIDVVSTLDQRPNLLDLSPKAFESFVQNLFTKMGYETDQFRSSNDGGIDCMAYKRDPVAPMKIAVQREPPLAS